MPLTRLQLKNSLKSRRGLTRDREDGLVPDTIIHEAIEEAIIEMGLSTELLTTTMEFSLVAGKYKYPMPEYMYDMRMLYYRNSEGVELPVAIVSEEQFKAGRDMVDDTSSEPAFATYPQYQSQVIEPFGLMRPNKDFVETSYITEGHTRTVEDSGINLGRTHSGIRISPGDRVWNLTRNAYGYVDFLDTITDLASAVTLAAGTTTSVAKHPVAWPATIKEDDIICTPSSGNVTTYAFVVSVNGTDLTYTDVRGAETSFASGDIVKVGTAQKIRLDLAAPHRGLREGSSNVFNKGATTATMAGTTFTDTRCTGSSPSGASVGEVAIASGGSHGVITAVGSDYIDVEGWIGGTPAAAEAITIQSCDEYQVETMPQIESILQLGPTPNVSDAAGVRSMIVSFIKRPFIPQNDYQYIDIPEKYRNALYKCCDWKLHELAGNKSIRELGEYEQAYRVAVAQVGGDEDRGPKGQVMTVMGNRTGAVRRLESRYMTRSGVRYNIDNLIE